MKALMRYIEFNLFYGNYKPSYAQHLRHVAGLLGFLENIVSSSIIRLIKRKSTISRKCVLYIRLG